MYYDRVDISEGMTTGKSSNRKECIIFQYWFFNHRLRFQDICNSWYDLTILCFNTTDIGIISVKGVDYRCIILNKSKAIHLLEKLC